MGTESKEKLKVFGATLQGFTQACININIVAGSKASELIGDIEVNGWYPFERLRDIERTVIESYENAGPILERVGMEMMLSWYNPGPGKGIIKRGVELI
jgi:hypothetical protein